MDRTDLTILSGLPSVDCIKRSQSAWWSTLTIHERGKESASQRANLSATMRTKRAQKTWNGETGALTVEGAHFVLILSGKWRAEGPWFTQTKRWMCIFQERNLQIWILIKRKRRKNRIVFELYLPVNAWQNALEPTPLGSGIIFCAAIL